MNSDCIPTETRILETMNNYTPYTTYHCTYHTSTEHTHTHTGGPLYLQYTQHCTLHSSLPVYILMINISKSSLFSVKYVIVEIAIKNCVFVCSVQFFIIHNTDCLFCSVCWRCKVVKVYFRLISQCIRNFYCTVCYYSSTCS